MSYHFCSALRVGFFVFAFGQSALQAHVGQWMTPDLYVRTVPERTGYRAGSHPSQDCRAEIAGKMCLVDPVDMPWTVETRPCLPGGEVYAKHFEELYDVYPPALQRMFCSLRNIFIEKSFFGTAYAGLDRAPGGQIVSAQIGIRQSVLDEKLDLPTWASWKEQLSFGGVEDSYKLTPGLPTVLTSSTGGGNDFLYFVIAHEFGHIFDFANRLNGYKDPSCSRQDKDKECEMADGSWGALSWTTDRTPRPENEFAHRQGLCFYWCEGKPLSKAAIFPLYHGLHATNFLSIYAHSETRES